MNSPSISISALSGVDWNSAEQHLSSVELRFLLPFTQRIWHNRFRSGVTLDFSRQGLNLRLLEGRNTS